MQANPIRVISLVLWFSLMVLTPFRPAHAGNVIHVPSRQAATIQQGIDIARSGDTVLVQPGTYHEAINLSGKAIHLLGAKGPAATKIDATGLDTSVVTIASGEGRGTIIEGFTITGGTGTIVDDTFLRGGGMYIAQSSPVVRHCIFAANTATQGGGVYVEEGNPDILDSTFVMNAADSGGGLLARLGSDPSIKNSHFLANSADWAGGGVSIGGATGQIIGCLFEENTAVIGGGFIVSGNAAHGPALVYGSTFRQNGRKRGMPGNGGGANVNTSGAAEFVECIFEGNDSTFGGGAFVIQQLHDFLPGVASFVNCHFEGNKAGGGAGLSNGGNSIVSNTLFIENAASLDHGPNGSGGAIFSGGGSSPWFTSLTIANSTFTGNSAESEFPGLENGDGGAIRIASGAAEIIGCAFSDNSAQQRGGGVSSTTSFPFVITDTMFTGNIAQTGGGLYATGDAEFTNCTFSRNAAAQSGGGMFATSSFDSPPMKVTDCIFENNTANQGGGIHGKVQIVSVVIDGNAAATGGGGFLLVGSTAKQATITNNTASIGGGLFAQGSTVDESFIADNIATSSGGGLRITGLVRDSTITRNASDGFGGGIHGSVVTLVGAVVSGNSASSGGGISSGSATARNSVIVDNSATEVGGGIRVTSKLTLQNSVVAGNVAPQGAGVWTEAVHNCILDTLFCENDPDNILGEWDDFQGNAFHESCPASWPPLDIQVNPFICPFGDLNGDSEVDGADLLMLLAAWGACANPLNCPADLNGDGVVDGLDLLLLLANWG